MSEGPGFRYIVLTERDSGQHWVCIRRDGTADWLQVVARFGDLERAEDCADVERKNKIEIIRPVGHLQPPRYRVVGRHQLLRQALNVHDTGDRSSLVFDDPPFERSALAQKQREA